MFHSFFGGVNPAPHKENTRRKPIAQLEQPPRRVYLPLTSGRDQALLPAVKPGDTVQVGQPVAISRGLESTVHASVSGRVTAIEDCPHAKLGTTIHGFCRDLRVIQENTSPIRFNQSHNHIK